MSHFDDVFEAVAAPVAEAEHGISVVFSRGGISSDPFTATAQDVDFETVDESGFKTRVHVRSFILPVADVALSGSPVEPQLGDELALTENSVALTFELMPPTDDMPVAIKLPGGYRWRVYAKRVS